MYVSFMISYKPLVNTNHSTVFVFFWPHCYRPCSWSTHLSMKLLINVDMDARIQRGGGSRGLDTTTTPFENIKGIGFLRNTGPGLDPLGNQKAKSWPRGYKSQDLN